MTPIKPFLIALGFLIFISANFIITDRVLKIYLFEAQRLLAAQNQTNYLLKLIANKK
jgi:hypothetical protein